MGRQGLARRQAKRKGDTPPCKVPSHHRGREELLQEVQSEEKYCPDQEGPLCLQGAWHCRPQGRFLCHSRWHSRLQGLERGCLDSARRQQLLQLWKHWRLHHPERHGRCHV